MSTTVRSWVATLSATCSASDDGARAATSWSPTGTPSGPASAIAAPGPSEATVAPASASALPRRPGTAS